MSAHATNMQQPIEMMLDSNQRKMPLVVGGSDCITTDTEFDKSDVEIISVKITKPAPDKTYPQILREIPNASKKGDFLRIRFGARSKENLPVTIVFGQKSPPYDSYFRAPVVLSTEWKDYALVFQTDKDSAAGSMNLSFQMPRRIGHMEFKQISLENWGSDPATKPVEVNRYDNPYAQQALDPQFYQQANQSIEKIRKGNLRFKVISQSGKVIPQAVVSIKQKRHKFNFGSALSSEALAGTESDTAKYKQLFIELFNTATPENELKWQAPEWNLPMTPEQMISWCRLNNLNVRGHNLLAPQKRAIPEAVVNLPPEQLESKIQSHIKDYATKYKGKVYIWDVLNEAVAESSALAGGLDSPVLSNAYFWVRDIDPDVLRSYNDYDILDYDSSAPGGKADRVFNFVSSLVEKKVPITTIGLQSHMNLPLIRGHEIQRQLDRFAKLGLPIEITEYDLPMPDDVVQAEYLEEFMTAVFSHPAVTSFVIWGFWERAQFLGKDGAELVKADWTERPSLATFRRLVKKEWWSDLQVTTDSTGFGQARVFLGDYEIEVKTGQKSVKQAVTVDSNSETSNVMICIPEL